LNSYDEDPAITNEVSELEIFIDKPVSEVWNQYLDLSSWVTSHDVKEVSNEKREVGMIMRITFKQAGAMGYPPPHHHYCKIIKMIPERQYVLKTYSEEGGSYGMRISAFDDARFYAEGTGTRVIFAYFGEHKAMRSRQVSVDMKVSDEGMLSNLKNLKKILESR
jgi:hypothetical protein